MRTHPDLHFFSGDTPFAKSNQASLVMFIVNWCSSEQSVLILSLLSGGAAKYIDYICQVESWYKICARNEWSIGTLVLCVQKRPYWGECSKCHMLMLYVLLWYINPIVNSIYILTWRVSRLKSLYYSMQQFLYPVFEFVEIKSE